MHARTRAPRRFAALVGAAAVAGALFVGAVAPAAASSISVVPSTVTVVGPAGTQVYPVWLTVPTTGVVGSYGWVVAHSWAGPIVVTSATPWICGLTSSGMMGTYLVRYYAPGYCYLNAYLWTGQGYGPLVATRTIIVYGRW